MTVQHFTSNAADRAMSDYQKLRRLMLALVVASCAGLLVFGASSHSAENSSRIAAIGLLLIASGIGGRMWSTLYIGGRKSSEVVQSGPYSTMRNPLYFFSTICAIGAGAQMGSIIAAGAFGIVCATAFLIVIKREETYLSAKFGEPFIEYASRVPRFIPNPKLYRDDPQVWFSPTLLGRTLKDGLVFFLPAVLFALLRLLQEQGHVPVLYRLW
ncbi:MAG: isoprenylcysteine carboxylmethyltransferase family protein [Rhizobiaceae bacterium]|nr:isoprenylcysteine carboxylmethyltransferase family protein [Rhizobiaceae bacterium]